MDFFEAQDHARRSTGALVVFFTLAVITLVVMTDLLALVVIAYMGNGGTFAERLTRAFDWGLMLSVSVGVLVVILIATLYKVTVLSGGGRVVAEGLGGKRIQRVGATAEHRRLLNVVEEMAIAAGMPVPPVYELAHEPGINAFAAGLTPGDAVIGITRGAVVELERDGLQGIIAHEFSHILNGDMRLNLRLIGVIYGIMVIGLIGQQILRSLRFGGARRTRSGKGATPALMLGAGLMVIGYGGTFFGSLIKAAVSRQREFLADASAVQFTRNPSGIAGALKRVGGLKAGSMMRSPAAPEVSHAFFSVGVGQLFGTLLSTHPPLADRIRRVEPGWDGLYDTRPPRPLTPGVREMPEGEEGEAVRRVMGTVLATSGVAAAVARVGRPSGEHIELARGLLARIPAPVRAAVAEPYGARAVIYALACDADEAVRARQFAHLDEHGDTGIGGLTRTLYAPVTALAGDLRLPLIDLALPALHQLSEPQHEMFRNNLAALIRMDEHTTLFEWSLQQVVTRHLDEAFGDRRRRRVGRLHINRARPECAAVLTVLAYAGGAQQGGPEAAFEEARKYLQLPGVEMRPVEDVGAEAVAAALDKLAWLTPLHKRRLLRACAACIHADAAVKPAEAELMRAVAGAIGCPIPVGGAP